MESWQARLLALLTWLPRKEWLFGIVFLNQDEHSALPLNFFLKEMDFLDSPLLFAFLSHELTFTVGTVKSDLEDERSLRSRWYSCNRVK